LTPRLGIIRACSISGRLIETVQGRSETNEFTGVVATSAASVFPDAPVRNEGRERDANLLDRVTECATAAISNRFGTGPVDARIRGHVISAMR
jgi:hypothetical protein